MADVPSSRTLPIVIAGLGAGRAMVLAGCVGCGASWVLGAATGVIASCSSTPNWWDAAFWPIAAVGTATAILRFGVRAWRREMRSIRAAVQPGVANASVASLPLAPAAERHNVGQTG